MSLTHIETIELGSSQASITFSSISQDFDDLVVLLALRSDRADVLDTLTISLNGGGTYDGVLLRGDGSSVLATDFTSATIGYIGGASTTSNTFSNISIYIPNYTAAVATTISSDSVFENNATTARQAIFALEETTAAAITSLGFSANNGNLVTGTVISLYGVTAGGDGTVTTA